MTAYWLIKSEPDVYGWDLFVADGSTAWTGVRNHSAKLNLMAMAVGDQAFFYHSNEGKEVVGVATVTRTAYPDPTAEAGSPWVCVDVAPVGKMAKPVGLAAIKVAPKLEGLALIKLSRLSVVPVSAAHWRVICGMGGWERMGGNRALSAL